MATPSEYPEFATLDVALPGGSQNKIVLPTILKETGYDVDNKPAAQHFNWLFNNIYQWIVDLDERLNSAAGGLISLQDVYPVGSVYMNESDGTNPATIFGFGTWVSLGSGRVLVGAGTNTDNNGLERTFTTSTSDDGTYRHTLSVNEMPSHKHSIKLSHEQGGSHDNNGWPQVDYSGPFATHDASQPDGSQSYRNGTGNPLYSTGGGQSHNNMPPFFVVNVWYRTA